MFCGEEVLLFLWITLSLQNIFYKYLLSSVGSVADSRKSFSENETRVLLLFCGEEVLLFLWITLSLQNIFYKYFLSSVGSVADSRKSFSENETQICRTAKL